MNELTCKEVLSDHRADMRLYEVTGFSREEIAYMQMGRDESDKRERFLDLYDNHNGENAHMWITAGYGMKNLEIMADRVCLTTWYACD